MSKVLSVKGMEHLNQISSKYRFQDKFELEQEDVVQFCRDFQQAEQLGLSVDADDSDWIEQVLDIYTSGE